MTAKKTTRVQIELPNRSMDRLKELKEKTEANSYAEVTKNSYILYEKIIELSESGHIFFVKDSDGNVKEIEFLLR